MKSLRYCVDADFLTFDHAFQLLCLPNIFEQVCACPRTLNEPKITGT
jgi:hypothetical protein